MSDRRNYALVAVLVIGCADGVGKGGDDTSAPTGANTAPTAPQVQLDPPGATSADALVATITADATDAEGGSITYRYAWSVDGAAADDITGDTVPADRTEKGQVWSVEVYPSDGELEGPPGTAEATIDNAPPSITLSLAPDPATTADMLTATAAAEDPDGDPLTLTYAWLVNGVETGETGETLPGGVWFDGGDVVEVVVIAEDDSGAAAEATAEITITNSPPSGSMVSIDPSSPTDSSDLVCLASAADDDGDALTYTFAWEVDGASFSDTEETTWPGDTVGAEHTAVGEVWTCTAFANDGAEDGPSGSDSATIIAWEGPRNFDPCGAVGMNGPEQVDCDAIYAGTTLDGDVVVSKGLQEWIVPSDGNYRIEAYGGQGAAGATGYLGGLGAWVAGSFELKGGDILLIAIGQMGVGQNSESNGGGGGGTWIMESDGTPLLIAGGGGGTRASVLNNGCNAVAGEYAVQGSGGVETWACPLKTTGLGEGGIMSSSSWGSAGGGYNSNGGDDPPWGLGGLSWFNGLMGGYDGGYACGLNAEGGFGGGGGGNGCYGGGGGGGYSGGDGGRVAGGGGSYNAGTDADGLDGDNTGDGRAIIDLVE